MTANHHGVAIAVPKDVHDSGMFWELHAAASGIRAIRVHSRNCSSGSSGSHLVADGTRRSNSDLSSYHGAPRCPRWFNAVAVAPHAEKSRAAEQTPRPLRTSSLFASATA